MLLPAFGLSPRSQRLGGGEGEAERSQRCWERNDLETNNGLSSHLGLPSVFKMIPTRNFSPTEFLPQVFHSFSSEFCVAAPPILLMGPLVYKPLKILNGRRKNIKPSECGTLWDRPGYTCLKQIPPWRL